MMNHSQHYPPVDPIQQPMMRQPSANAARAYPSGARPSAQPARRLPSPVQYYRHQIAQRAAPWWYSPWWVFLAATGLISLVLLPVFILAGTYAYTLFSGRIFSGVQSGGASLSGLTREQAEDKLNLVWNQQRNVVLSDGKRVWEVKPLELGLWMDPKASVEKAYQIGRGPDGFQEMFWLLRAGHWSVSPEVVFRPDLAQKRLEQLTTEVNLPAENATLRFEGGQWVAAAGQNGLSLNVEESLKRLAGEPEEVFFSGYLPLATQVVAPRVSNAAPLLAKVQSALDQSLKIRAYDPITDEMLDIAIPREVLATWLTVEAQGEDVSFGLDNSKLDEYLETWKTHLEPERTLAPYQLPPELASRWLAGDPRYYASSIIPLRISSSWVTR